MKVWLQLVLPWGGVTPKIRPFFRFAAALTALTVIKPGLHLL